MATITTKAVGRVLAHVRESVLRRDGAGLTDAELLGRFIDRREEAAFEALLRRHGPMVLGVCRRVLRNEAEAEDAFQATFLVLVRKATTVRPRSMVGNWLYGVARRTAMKAKAMNYQRREREKEAGTRPAPGIPAPDWQHLLELLDEELAHLPEHYRAPIIACDLEGKSIKEAARQLGCPEGTVATRLVRGRAMLARRLGGRRLAVSGGLLVSLLAQSAASAGVPAPLMVSTIKAASLFAAGNAAAVGVISGKVVALTDGVLRTMLLTKLKIAAFALLALTVAACTIVAAGLAAQAQAAKSGSKEGSKAGGTAKAKDKADDPREIPADKIVADKIIAVIQEQVLGAALSGDGKFVVTVTAPPFDVQGVKETRIKVWNAKSGELRRTIQEGKFNYYRVALSPSAKQLLVGSPPNRKDTELYDIADLTNEPRLIHTLANSANAWSVSFASDGKALLIGTTDGSIKAYDAKSGEQKWSKDAHDGHVSFVTFSKDGKYVVSAGTDKTVQIRDARDGSLTSTLEGHTKQVTSASFSPDGKFVASGGYDGTVRIWDVGTAKVVHKIDVADTSVRSLAFSPDGKMLAIGGLKNVGQTVLGLWNVNTGKQVKELSGHQGGAFSVAFSADGTMVMSGGGDGGVGLWRLTPAKK